MKYSEYLKKFIGIKGSLSFSNGLGEFNIYKDKGRSCIKEVGDDFVIIINLESRQTRVPLSVFTLNDMD